MGALALVCVVAGFHLLGGWYFSNVLHDDALDAEARRAELEPDYNVEVLGVEEGSITLAAGGDVNQRRPGVWGVRWPAGYGLASEIIDESDDRVTRSFEVLSGPRPEIGETVEFDSKAFPDDPSVVLGVAPEVVEVAGPLGDYESWFFPGDRDTWVLLLHGNTPNRLDMAKLLPSLLHAGYPALLVSVRNDPGAPPDPSGMLRYGETEWEDLEAAVHYASDHGAADVVLVGPSMGGGVVMSFLERSPARDVVRAVVLDAPMLDFGRTVDFEASQESLPILGLPLPATLTATAKWMTTWRFDIDWSELDYLRTTDQLTVPILVFHGTDDDDIPLATSRDLADLRPDLVTLVEVPGAGHLSTWNVDPPAYEHQLLEFIGE